MTAGDTLLEAAPSVTAPAKVGVALPAGSDERSYDVLIGPGLIENAGDHLAPVLPRRRRVVIVTDATVARHHLPRLEAALDRAGITHDAVTVPAGEASKSWDRLGWLLDELLARKVDRGSLILALGGGVVGDLAGFAASIVMRGVDFVQIPTTLLAQVDSSVGGKTAVNMTAGKNMVGSFHQPRLVLADLDCLGTLDRRQLGAGYAEAVKHAVLGDAPFFGWFEENGPQVMTGDLAGLGLVVRHSCMTKAGIVAEDEREAGKRALLNLGHTFGHALEAETGFGDTLLHGEGVAVGMGLALDLSARLGLAPAGDADRLRRHFDACGIPARMSQIRNEPFDPDRLLAHMARDKKARDGGLTFVLARGIGDALVVDGVDPAMVRATLAAA